MKRTSKDCRTYTRKQRKRERKLKRFTKRLNEGQVKTLKAIAKRMSEIENPHVGQKFNCRSCSRSWEYGYDNVLVFCGTCFYFGACLKELVGFKTCPECERGER